jgi:NADH-quinone oxidoreductase subunit C
LAVPSESSEIETKLPEREKAIAEEVKEKFGDNILEMDIKHRRIKIKIKPEQIRHISEYMKDDLELDHVVSISGVDYPNDQEIEVIYHVSSYGREEIRDLVVALSIRIPRSDPKTPTLTKIWPSSEYIERETYEMMGIIFEGHPKLEKLILPEDWDDIPPLRKDFRSPGR